MVRYSRKGIKLAMVLGLSFMLCGRLNAESETQKTYSLNMSEVAQIALKNNVDIQLIKYDHWIKKQDKDITQSIYDTLFRSDVKYRNDQGKNTSTIFGTKTVNNDYDIGLSQVLPTGTSIDLDLKNNRSANNALFSTSAVTHDSSLGVSVTQDLGKNLFGIQDRGNIKVTLIDVENSQYTTYETIEKYLASIQKAYWDVVLAKEMVEIQREMVDQSKRLFDLNSDKLTDGLAEKPDVLAAEANYKKQLNGLNDLNNQARNKVELLALALNISEEIFDIVPLDHLNSDEYPINNDEALRAAFNNRQDFKRLHNEVKAQDIKLSMKKNNLWPEINLTASLERNGLGDRFTQSVQQISEEDNPEFFAGVSVNVPLFNKRAKAELKQEEYRKAKVLLNLKYTERTIYIEITNLVRDTNVFRQLAVNAQEIAQLQYSKLEEEQKRFSSGRSNTDTIIRFQADVINSKAEALTAKHRYKFALINLEQKSGVLLKKYWNDEL